MLLPKTIRADKHWTDYRARKEAPFTREWAGEVCSGILRCSLQADVFRDALRGYVTDIGREDTPSGHRIGLIKGVLNNLTHHRELLFRYFDILMLFPDSVLDEFRITCKEDIVFGRVLQGHSYLDAGGQLLADTLSVLNGRLSQKDVDHWLHGGNAIEVDGTFESLVLAGKHVEHMLNRLDDVFKGWPPRVVFEQHCIGECLLTLKRLNLATEDDIRELDRSFEVVDKENAASDVPEAQLQGKPGLPPESRSDAHAEGRAPTDSTPAESIVLHVSQDAKGMCLRAGGKEIRFSARKGIPTKQMQIVRVLIAKHPKGATAAELLAAGWPKETQDKDHVKKLALCLVSAMQTLQNKAEKCGLPENIFPLVNMKSIYNSGSFALTCRAIKGADEFLDLDDWHSRALPVKDEILGEEERHFSS